MKITLRRISFLSPPACVAVAALAAFAAMQPAQADQTLPCRIAFDMGSSGIRAGASNSQRSAKRELDALGPLWAGKGISAIEPAVSAALRELPAQANFDAACARVGGGFSAWRLALQQDPAALSQTLRRLHRDTGVAVLVMPPQQEGAYGHYAARQTLGDQLTTTHVLDIGGGSLQVAGEQRSFAAPLGQKSWHRILCERLRDANEVPCALQPMDDRDLTRARALLTVRLADSGLPPATTMTAISRPVSRGVYPAVRRVTPQAVDREAQPRLLRQSEVTAAIAALAPLDLPATAARVQSEARHAAFLLSDLLLVEGLLGLTADRRLAIAETDLDNLPGLLADAHAFAWQRHYGCYLDRLAAQGIGAYASNPATCPTPDAR